MNDAKVGYHITIPKNWKPNDRLAFLQWMLKIQNKYYYKIE